MMGGLCSRHPPLCSQFLWSSPVPLFFRPEIFVYLRKSCEETHGSFTHLIHFIKVLSLMHIVRQPLGFLPCLVAAKQMILTPDQSLVQVSPTWGRFFSSCSWEGGLPHFQYLAPCEQGPRTFSSLKKLSVRACVFFHVCMCLCFVPQELTPFAKSIPSDVLMFCRSQEGFKHFVESLEEDSVIRQTLLTMQDDALRSMVPSLINDVSRRYKRVRPLMVLWWGGVSTVKRIRGIDVRAY